MSIASDFTHTEHDNFVREVRTTFECTPYNLTTEEAAMIHVFLVDDQPIVRQGLRMRLALEPDIEVVGEAENGLRALKLVEASPPEVIVMDVEMPEMDGITATHKLHQQYPGIHIIMLSIHDNPLMRARAEAAGAVAFVEKRNGVNALLNEIRRVMDVKSGLKGDLPWLK